MGTKKECGRCCGKGYIPAFGHVAGGTCFNCMGRGFFVVSAASEKRKQAASERRNASAAAKRDAAVAAFKAVVAEMNAVYGPFNVETELGFGMLDLAVAKATGKNIVQIRDQRLAA